MSAKSAQRQLDPAVGYRIFDKLLDRVRPNVVAHSRDLAGYPRTQVTRRLLQRIAELAAYPCVVDAAERYRVSVEPELTNAGPCTLGGLRFMRGRVTVTPATWLRALLNFAAQWTRVLFCLVRSREVIDARRVTILMGVGQGDISVDGTDRRFADFCRRGPLGPLREATHLLVESALQIESVQSDHLSYARHPLLAVFRSDPPRGRRLLRFLAMHFAVAAEFAVRCLTHPLSCLLARDMALHAVAHDANEHDRLEAVVITNSNFQVQPLWMRALPGRRFKTHMAWYSQNTTPFVFSEDGVRSDLPHYRHVAVDVHWVWTESYADYVRKLMGATTVFAVGPILWHLPEPRAATSPELQVAIFDVTPVQDAYAQQVGLTRNYYSATNMVAFLGQAVAACERAAQESGSALTPVLKHKRGYSELHDSSYIKVVNQLVALGRLRIVPPHTNMYSLITNSVAIIVAPYSSPAYVASALGVEAIYFDASGSIKATYEPAPFVDFTASPTALTAKLLAALQAPNQLAGNA